MGSQEAFAAGPARNRLWISCLQRSFQLSRLRHGSTERPKVDKACGTKAVQLSLSWNFFTLLFFFFFKSSLFASLIKVCLKLLLLELCSAWAAFGGRLDSAACFSQSVTSEKSSKLLFFWASTQCVSQSCPSWNLRPAKLAKENDKTDSLWDGAEKFQWPALVATRYISVYSLIYVYEWFKRIKSKSKQYIYHCSAPGIVSILVLRGFAREAE